MALAQEAGKSSAPAVPAVTSGLALRGAGWALFAVAAWSGWFVVTRFGLTGTESGLTPGDLAALRFGISGLLLLPVLVGRFGRLPWSAWRDGVILAKGSGAPFALVVGTGLELAPAGHAAALTPGTMPLFAALLGWGLYGERLGRIRLLGFGLIGCGAAALGGLGAGDELLAHGLFLIGALIWAVYTVRLRRSGLSGLEGAALVCVYSGLGFAPWHLALGGGAERLLAAPASEILLQGLYQGVLVGVVALLAYNRAIALLGATGAAAFTSLVPVLTTLLAVPLLGEWPSLLDGSAVAAIAGGVLLATLGGLRKPGPAA